MADEHVIIINADKGPEGGKALGSIHPHLRAVLVQEAMSIPSHGNHHAVIVHSRSSAEHGSQIHHAGFGPVQVSVAKTIGSRGGSGNPPRLVYCYRAAGSIKDPQVLHPNAIRVSVGMVIPLG